MARILIVDDDTAVQATIQLLLERAGHSGVTAGGGRQGGPVVAAGGFFLLFFHFFMSGRGGGVDMRGVFLLLPAVSTYMGFGGGGL